MPKIILYDPEKHELTPLAHGDNARADGVIFALENDRLVRQCCAIIRGICAKRGIPESRVPVFHRLRGHVRFMDIRQGVAGGSHWCVLLCEMEWRIATREEQKAHQLKVETARRAAITARVKNQTGAALAASAMNQHLTKESGAALLATSAVQLQFSK